MSSYFDKLAGEIADARNDHAEDDAYVEVVRGIEDRLFRDVTALTGDREFPFAFREKALDILACKGLNRIEWMPENQWARDRCMIGTSRAVEAMHNLFHEVASSRTVTRFGLLSDSPVGDAMRRDEHDTDDYRE